MQSDIPQRIDQGLRELAQEKPHPGQMNRMLVGARRRMDGRSSVTRIMTRTAMAAGAAALLVVGLLLIPISYEVCLGTVVSAQWPGADSSPSAVTAALAGTADLANYSVNWNGADLSAQLLFRDVGVAEAKRRTLACLDPLLGSTQEVELGCREIKKRVGGNALAAMTGGVIRVHAAGLSDPEIEAAIAAELSAWGAGGSDVQVVTGPDGERSIDITVEDPPEGEETITLEVTQ